MHSVCLNSSKKQEIHFSVTKIQKHLKASLLLPLHSNTSRAVPLVLPLTFLGFLVVFFWHILRRKFIGKLLLAACWHSLFNTVVFQLLCRCSCIFSSTYVKKSHHGATKSRIFLLNTVGSLPNLNHAFFC